MKQFSLDFAKTKSGFIFRHSNRNLFCTCLAITCVIVLDVESQLSNASNVKQEELQLFLDKVNTAIQQLQKLVTDSTMFLTPYDLRTSQQVRTFTVYLVQ